MTPVSESESGRRNRIQDHLVSKKTIVCSEAIVQLIVCFSLKHHYLLLGRGVCPWNVFGWCWLGQEEPQTL